MSDHDLAPTANLGSKDLEQLCQLLLEKRRELLELYDHDIRAGKTFNADDVSEDMDRASAATSRELMFQLSTEDRRQLLEVEDALKRMRTGTYGVCEYSGQPISLARLQAVPWARFTIDVQELIEKGRIDLPQRRPERTDFNRGGDPGADGVYEPAEAPA